MKDECLMDMDCLARILYSASLPGAKEVKVPYGLPIEDEANLALDGLSAKPIFNEMYDMQALEKGLSAIIDGRVKIVPAFGTYKKEFSEDILITEPKIIYH